MTTSIPSTTLYQAMALICLGASAAIPSAAQETADSIIQRMNATEERHRAELKEFWGNRRYILTNERWKRNAEMEVEVHYRQGQGKQFDMLASTGSPDIQNRVFKKLIEAESEGSRNAQVDASRVGPDNYSFKLLGTEQKNGHDCFLIQMTPRKRTKYLLDGKLWVDRQDYAMVRMEGRTAANVSFWVGRPYVTQDFSKINGHWLASNNHTVAESRFMGKTELQIHYSQYSVNGSGTRSLAARKPVSKVTVD